MATSRGGEAVRRFMAQIQADIERKVLRGAARAAASVIADEIKTQSVSHVVADAVVIKSKASASAITAKITVKPGWPMALGIWQEYGTAPHFISVNDAQREGRSVGRINRQNKDGRAGESLVIGGKFVGTTVHHPGARAHPVFRPSLDAKAADAVAAAQAYINARVKPSGITGDDEPEDEGV